MRITRADVIKPDEWKLLKSKLDEVMEDMELEEYKEMVVLIHRLELLICVVDLFFKDMEIAEA